MDEVDGMGAGDRAGMAELIKLIKTSKIPIICICNDRSSQKVRSLGERDNARSRGMEGVTGMEDGASSYC